MAGAGLETKATALQQEDPEAPRHGSPPLAAATKCSDLVTCRPCDWTGQSLGWDSVGAEPVQLLPSPGSPGNLGDGVTVECPILPVLLSKHLKLQVLVQRTMSLNQGSGDVAGLLLPKWVEPEVLVSHQGEFGKLQKQPKRTTGSTCCAQCSEQRWLLLMQFPKPGQRRTQS